MLEKYNGKITPKYERKLRPHEENENSVYISREEDDDYWYISTWDDVEYGFGTYSIISSEDEIIELVEKLKTQKFKNYSKVKELIEIYGERYCWWN